MMRIRRGWIWLIGMSLLVFVWSPAERLHGEIRAGVGVRDVTPKKRLAVSGGIGPSGPVKRILGNLTVRALVVADGDTKAAICSTDFLGFPGVLCDKVRKQVKGIRSEHILIGATHQHSGPDCYGFRNAKGETAADLEYLDMVCTELSAAINEANRQLQGVRVKIATGTARGKIAYNYYAEQLYDPRCHVMQFVGGDGKAVATLVNYACHPEVIGAEQGIMSPDFVGPLYDRIEQRGGGVGIYMNSALGGMVTADCRGANGRDVQRWEECERIGTLLADESLRIVAGAEVQKDPDLYCGSTTIRFPIDNPMMRKILETSPLALGAKVDNQQRISTQLNVVNLGNAQMLTVPGEALPNIGYYLKRKMHGEHNFLLGLTNDAFGYILTKVDWNSFERYNYISRTCLGEMTGEIFIEEALAFVDQCPRPNVIGN